ncbi:super-infection exclusion protein B [Photobacterium leiognathi]|uniref:super-infection exclusion protein B n=1 Tax=Photobacterium leiognathi TaxID=553611 RepID=UPI002738441F|nr:super-infection exclusion protein B [Photobacterium leiognathi]
MKLLRENLKRLLLDRLEKLDPREKSVLREYYLQGQNTIKLPMDHPVVAGLINVGVLQLIGQHGRMSTAGMLFSMKISDFVRENLTNDLLDLPSGEPSHEEIDFLKNNRPPFMNSILREESLFNRW